jgi:hypothetical protein
MPYFRCTQCAVKFYSAASETRCAECGVPLRKADRLDDATPRAQPRRGRGFSWAQPVSVDDRSPG